MRELLKRRNLETRTNRSTSVYRSLLGDARNSRKSSRILLAPREMFSERSALTNSTTEFSVWSARRLYE
jgi:hypothetical protein